ncbi:MAG TPA: hypothetical protein VFU92_09595 [Usitatibacter sp.]|nr:hypothetical protein [Usitatibacter sp.]
MSSVARVDLETRPGRTCPISYRYSPRAMNRDPQVVAGTLYVVGGLYGNVEALAAIEDMAAREDSPVTIVFNGDFHWFDVDDADFARVTRSVLGHAAIRGNVETEIAGEDSGAGCGCAYPVDVSDAEVSRSNRILERLRDTASRAPALRKRLGELPMHLTAQVGEARIGIIHGDAASLAGWGFAHDRLDDPSHRRWVESMFREANVHAFASTHTCLPAFRRFEAGAVANNGAAGMPNFVGSRCGLLTRVAAQPHPMRLYGMEVAGVSIDALRVDYDHERWIDRFLASWPEGSPAHESYHRRMVHGTRFRLEQALPKSA